MIEEWNWENSLPYKIDLISLLHFVIVYLFIHVPELLFESSQKWNNQQCVKIRKYWREIDLMCSNSAYKKDKNMYSVYTKCLCWNLGWILYMQYITRRHDNFKVLWNKKKQKQKPRRPDFCDSKECVY